MYDFSDDSHDDYDLFSMVTNALICSWYTGKRSGSELITK